LHRIFFKTLYNQQLRKGKSMIERKDLEEKVHEVIVKDQYAHHFCYLML
jgi:hypothetical protein